VLIGIEANVDLSLPVELLDLQGSTIETPKPAPYITSNVTNSDITLIVGISIGFCAFLILFVVVLVMIMKRSKRNSVASLDQPYEHSGIPLELLRRLRQPRQPSSVSSASDEPLPRYTVTRAPAVVPISPYSESGSYDRVMSIQSLSVQLNIPNLLRVSLVEALEMDFSWLEESCEITEEEYSRLMIYKRSIE
jgi:hypothetical protein